MPNASSTRFRLAYTIEKGGGPAHEPPPLESKLTDTVLKYSVGVTDARIFFMSLPPVSEADVRTFSRANLRAYRSLPPGMSEALDILSEADLIARFIPWLSLSRINPSSIPVGSPAVAIECFSDEQTFSSDCVALINGQ